MFDNNTQVAASTIWIPLSGGHFICKSGLTHAKMVRKPLLTGGLMRNP